MSRNSWVPTSSTAAGHIGSSPGGTPPSSYNKRHSSNSYGHGAELGPEGADPRALEMRPVLMLTIKDIQKKLKMLNTKVEHIVSLDYLVTMKPSLQVLIEIAKLLADFPCGQGYNVKQLPDSLAGKPKLIAFRNNMDRLIWENRSKLYIVADYLLYTNSFDNMMIIAYTILDIKKLLKGDAFDEEPSVEPLGNGPSRIQRRQNRDTISFTQPAKRQTDNHIEKVEMVVQRSMSNDWSPESSSQNYDTVMISMGVSPPDSRAPLHKPSIPSASLPPVYAPPRLQSAASMPSTPLASFSISATASASTSQPSSTSSSASASQPSASSTTSTSKVDGDGNQAPRPLERVLSTHRSSPNLASAKSVDSPSPFSLSQEVLISPASSDSVSSSSHSSRSHHPPSTPPVAWVATHVTPTKPDTPTQKDAPRPFLSRSSPTPSLPSRLDIFGTSMAVLPPVAPLASHHHQEEYKFARYYKILHEDGKPVSQPPNPIDLIVSPPDVTNTFNMYRIEEGARSLYDVQQAYPVVDTDLDVPHYLSGFYGKDHVNLLGCQKGSNLRPVAVSARSVPKMDESSMCDIYVLVRTVDADERFCIQYILAKKEAPPMTAKALLRIFKKALPHLAECNLAEVKDHGLHNELQDFEAKQLHKNSKIGILYARPDQHDEDLLYNNKEPTSEMFHLFLETLGPTIGLKGWPHFRGGLDVKTGTTGETSVHAFFREHEVMFHVSTMIPYTPGDPQQVERKRHLGNDIVVIVFMDVPTSSTPTSTDENHPPPPPFDFGAFRTQFNHVFMLVQPDPPPRHDDDPGFRVTMYVREEVNKFGPAYPYHYRFTKGDVFREFVLTKLINAERTTLRSPTFATKTKRTRREFLTSYITKFGKQ
eukprot:TRINITY_DN9227_c0_g1_i3.p1 TRINITY_DN9227_c0_g1~~TRINITY_DN9227_c0_g1_i3.p1  ORF type:complete len:875 (-),score=217.84 TRINITY_DN9227_c0_g1_i3:19-2643(-)